MSRSSKPDPVLNALGILTEFAIPIVEKSREATPSERQNFGQHLADTLETLTPKQRVDLTTELSSQSEKPGQVFKAFSKAIRINHEKELKTLKAIQTKEAEIKRALDKAVLDDKRVRATFNLEVATADRRIESERIVEQIEGAALQTIIANPQSYSKFSKAYREASKHTDLRDARMDALLEIENRVNGFVKKGSSSPEDREYIGGRISFLNEHRDSSKLLKTHLTHLVTQQEVASERDIAALAHKDVINLVDGLRRSSGVSYETRSLTPTSSRGSRSGSDMSTEPAPRQQRGRF